jgi:hypothetical protein
VLEAEQRRWDFANKRANDVIDRFLKIEKIKDPQLRERIKAAILAGDHALLPHDDAAA